MYYRTPFFTTGKEMIVVRGMPVTSAPWLRDRPGIKESSHARLAENAEGTKNQIGKARDAVTSSHSKI
jgi:hypothetical protein